MSKQRKSLYRGKLNEWLPEMPSPRSPFDVPGSLSTPAGQAWSAEWEDQLKLLFEHFSIPTDDQNAWRKLVLALAGEHVKGFRHKSSGRPNLLNTPEAIAAQRELLTLVQRDERRRFGRKGEKNLRPSGQA